VFTPSPFMQFPSPHLRSPLRFLPRMSKSFMRDCGYTKIFFLRFLFSYLLGLLWIRSRSPIVIDTSYTRYRIDFESAAQPCRPLLLQARSRRSALIFYFFFFLCFAISTPPGHVPSRPLAGFFFLRSTDERLSLALLLSTSGAVAVVFRSILYPPRHCYGGPSLSPSFFSHFDGQTFGPGKNRAHPLETGASPSGERFSFHCPVVDLGFPLGLFDLFSPYLFFS